MDTGMQEDEEWDPTSLAPTMSKSSGPPPAKAKPKATPLVPSHARAGKAPILSPTKTPFAGAKAPYLAPAQAKSKGAGPAQPEVAKGKTWGLLSPSQAPAKAKASFGTTPVPGKSKAAVLGKVAQAPTVAKGAAKAKMLAAATSASDDKAYTFLQLKGKYADSYTPDEIQTYWDSEMWAQEGASKVEAAPAPAAAGHQDGGAEDQTSWQEDDSSQWPQQQHQDDSSQWPQQQHQDHSSQWPQQLHQDHSSQWPQQQHQQGAYYQEGDSEEAAFQDGNAAAEEPQEMEVEEASTPRSMPKGRPAPSSAPRGGNSLLVGKASAVGKAVATTGKAPTPAVGKAASAVKGVFAGKRSGAPAKAAPAWQPSGGGKGGNWGGGW